MTGGVSRSQACRQQATRVALEDEHGMVHVLPVSAAEKAELLLTVGGIVGGIQIEQDLAAPADLVAAKTNELGALGVAQADQITSPPQSFPSGCKPSVHHF